MATVTFAQIGAKTATGFVTTDQNPPKLVMRRTNLPASCDVELGDYVFTCEATDAVGTKFTAIVGGAASQSAVGTITGDAGTVATEPLDVPFSLQVSFRDAPNVSIERRSSLLSKAKKADKVQIDRNQPRNKKNPARRGKGK